MPEEVKDIITSERNLGLACIFATLFPDLFSNCVFSMSLTARKDNGQPAAFQTRERNLAPWPSTAPVKGRRLGVPGPLRGACSLLDSYFRVPEQR